MKPLLLLWLTILSTLVGFSQATVPQERLWLRGDTILRGERVFQIQVDAQGDIYCGINNYETFLFDPTRPNILVKYNAEGDLIWRRTITDTPMSWENLLLSAHDQTVVAHGTQPGSIDIIKKIDRHGQDVWTTYLPQSHKTYDVVMDDDGYLYLTGWNYQGSSPVIAVQKISPQGEILWNRGYEKPEEVIWSEWGYRIALGPKGDIYVSSWHPSEVGVVRRLTSDGDLVWQTFLAQPSEADLWTFPTDILVNDAGEAYLAYRVDSIDYHGNNYMDVYEDAILLKLSAEGQELWRQVLAPGQPHGRAQIQQLLPYGEDQVLMVANRPFGDFGLMGLLARINSDGTWEWETTLSLGGSFATLNDAEVGADGFIYAGGISPCCFHPEHELFYTPLTCCMAGTSPLLGPFSRSQWAVYKVNPYGEEVWRMNEAGQGDYLYRDYLYDIALAQDGNVLAAGWLVRRNRSLTDTLYWGVPSLGKYSNPGDTRPYELKVYPNPTRQGLHLWLGLPEAWPIEVELYDLTGRAVAARTFETYPGRLELTWHPALNPGLYLYRITLGPNTQTGKIWWLE